MRKNLLRLSALPAVGAIVTGLLLTSSGASADADPVTGGTAALNVSLTTTSKLAVKGIVTLPTKPATVSYDKSTMLEYDLPVVGGDASTNTLYGSLKLGGGLVIVDGKTKTTLVLKNVTFIVQDDTITVTPNKSANPIVLLDVVGNHDYTTTQPETFSSSDVQVDPVGAQFLNKTLGTNAFRGGQHVGTFSASWNNSVDAG